jgi:hypothetical protein
MWMVFRDGTTRQPVRAQGKTTICVSGDYCATILCHGPLVSIRSMCRGYRSWFGSKGSRTSGLVSTQAGMRGDFAKEGFGRLNRIV